MDKQIDEGKLVIETLERLQRNNDYQYLCSHLERIKSKIDKQIFDDYLDHELKRTLITRRNTIKLFMELSGDLIEEFTPSEN